MSKDCPCKGCGRRTVEPNCHGPACREYTDWLAEKRAEQKALRDWTEADVRRQEHLARNCRRAKTKRQVGQR